ncbi:MAG: hypothetical protein QOK71_11140 [Nitrososphaeraceae archaeon]|nr:hypothetical protein [Nitrososphaeraceae archaeon]
MSKVVKNPKKTNTNKKKKINQNENKKTSKLGNNENLATKNRASQQKSKPEKDIIIERSTGRKEKFDTNRLAQTSSRSGIPFVMAKDIAEKTTEKIQNSINDIKSNVKSIDESDQSNKTAGSMKSEDDIIVTAGQVKNLVAKELQTRNRPEVASSIIGEPTNANSISRKPTINDKEPIQDNVAANKNRLRFDRSKVHKDERAA